MAAAARCAGQFRGSPMVGLQGVAGQGCAWLEAAPAAAAAQGGFSGCGLQLPEGCGVCVSAAAGTCSSRQLVAITCSRRILCVVGGLAGHPQAVVYVGPPTAGEGPGTPVWEHSACLLKTAAAIAGR